MSSPINDPHPNESAVAEPEAPAAGDPADFFGEPESENGASIEDSPFEPEGGAPYEPEAAAEPGEEGYEPKFEEDLADDEIEPDAPEQTPEAVPEATEPAAPEAEAAPVESEPEEASGSRREYVVLQEVVLDVVTLGEMLKAVRGGMEPMSALVEVHRTKVTAPVAALNAAWKLHKDAWDEPPRLVAITASKIRARTARPRVREVMGFEFAD